MERESHPVLLVVDMQNGFINDHSRAVIPMVQRAIAIAKQRHIPIIFTRFHNQVGGPYERLHGWHRLQSDEETSIVPELTDSVETVVDKSVYSAFCSRFAGMRDTEKWDTIYLCGVATDGCVLKTAVDAFERDLKPVVITDACSSHGGPDAHAAGLLLLRRFIGRDQLISLDDFANSSRIPSE
jgi:nicotinamidase-related amidase